MQLVARRRLDAQLEHEAVELRLGQRVRPLHLDRVLRRQHEERRRQRVGLLADRDRLLLHRLEQRRLRLGRRAVDLVGQHDVREDRPALELEAPRQLARRPLSTIRLVPRTSAGIRSGVNWMRENDRSSASASVRTSSVLPRPGHAFQQHVAAREQRRGDRARDLRLPDHAPRDLGQQAIDVGAESRRRLGGGARVHVGVARDRARSLFAFPAARCAAGSDRSSGARRSAAPRGPRSRPARLRPPPRSRANDAARSRAGRSRGSAAPPITSARFGPAPLATRASVSWPRARVSCRCPSGLPPASLPAPSPSPPRRPPRCSTSLLGQHQRLLARAAAAFALGHPGAFARLAAALFLAGAFAILPLLLPCPWPRPAIARCSPGRWPCCLLLLAVARRAHRAESAASPSSRRRASRRVPGARASAAPPAPAGAANRRWPRALGELAPESARAASPPSTRQFGSPSRHAADDWFRSRCRRSSRRSSDCAWSRPLPLALRRRLAFARQPPVAALAPVLAACGRRAPPTPRARPPPARAPSPSGVCSALVAIAARARSSACAGVAPPAPRPPRASPPPPVSACSAARSASCSRAAAAAASAACALQRRQRSSASPSLSLPAASRRSVACSSAASAASRSSPSTSPGRRGRRAPRRARRPARRPRAATPASGRRRRRRGGARARPHRHHRRDGERERAGRQHRQPARPPGAGPRAPGVSVARARRRVRDQRARQRRIARHRRHNADSTRSWRSSAASAARAQRTSEIRRAPPPARRARRSRAAASATRRSIADRPPAQLCAAATARGQRDDAHRRYRQRPLHRRSTAAAGAGFAAAAPAEGRPRTPAKS